MRLFVAAEDRAERARLASHLALTAHALRAEPKVLDQLLKDLAR